MYQFSDVVSLSPRTKEVLSLINALLEVKRGVEKLSSMTFDDNKSDCLADLLNAESYLRFELGVAVEDALTENPPKDYAEVAI